VQPVPQEQNLPVSGLKADLIQRLEENEVVVDEQLLQSVKKNTPKKKSAPKKKMLASKPTKSVVGKGRGNWQSEGRKCSAPNCNKYVLPVAGLRHCLTHRHLDE